MIIVENVEEFNDFISEYNENNSILIPYYNRNSSVFDVDELVLVYVHLMNGSDYVLPFNHNDTVNLEFELLLRLITDRNVFVSNKKKFNNFLNFDTLYDLDLMVYFTENKKIDKSDCYTHTHNFFSKFDLKDIGQIVPITKHIEYCTSLRNKYLAYLEDFEITDSYKKYNHFFLNNLSEIEKNGLWVDKATFKNRWNDKDRLISSDGLVFSEYNIYSITGRPSNNQHGINFAALNKSDGSRAAFKSRFGDSGCLIQFDYSSYHLRLISKLIGYDVPFDVNMHEYLGKQFYDKEQLTKDELKNIKSINFRQLYGTIEDRLLSVPFYNMTSNYIDILWDEFITNGYIETPVFKRPMKNNFYKKINKAKLFNYQLQAYETEQNMLMLDDVLKFIRDFKSKVVLYTYDSILIDFYMEDGKNLLSNIQHLMEQDGVPVGVQAGMNYHSLKDIKLP